jgi:hypothetical protein
LTSHAIESAATAVAARFRRDDFQLIEWFPREREHRFSEVTLAPIPAREVEHGTVAIGSGTDAHTIIRTTAIVRFTDPRWARRTEDDLARLLGSTGERLVKSIRAHNDRIIDAVDALTKEWSDR